MKTITKDLLVAAKFASKNPSRPVLNSVMITEDKFVATDSYKLIEITNDGEPVEEFPMVAGVKTVKKLEDPILIPAKDVLKKLKLPKATMPILEHAILTNDTDKTISLTTSDLETASTLQLKKIEGNFPDYESVMPKSEPTVTLKFDAKILKETLEAFITKDHQDIELEVRGDNEALIIKGTENSNINKKAMVMPKRS